MIPKILPCLWFDRNAEEAANFYAATFPDTHVDAVNTAPRDYPNGKAGDVLTVEFTLLGMPVMGLNGGPNFHFTEAISFQIATDTQEETDRYWAALTENGGSESVCGWCKDRFGLSWQVTPRRLSQLMTDPDKAKARKAMEAMMDMKKIHIATLERAVGEQGQ